MRHAKSSWKDSALSDFERPLNKRGRKAAPRMAEVLQSRELVPELVIASSAERARHTAELVSDTWTKPVETVLEDSLYHAGPLQYLASVKEHGNARSCVMVIGHNPGLEELVETLTGAEAWLPTAAVAVMAWEGSWEDRHSCELLDILRPRELFADD